jgi:hypothetical protein
MSTTELDQKIDQFSRDLQLLCAESIQNETSRKNLMDVVMRANAQLEAPVETVWRMIMSVSQLKSRNRHWGFVIPGLMSILTIFFEQPHAPAALMVLIRMGVVTDLVKASRPKTAKELSESCGGDELLIGMY